jgi:hypothetical protein
MLAFGLRCTHCRCAAAPGTSRRPGSAPTAMSARHVQDELHATWPGHMGSPPLFHAVSMLTGFRQAAPRDSQSFVPCQKKRVRRSTRSWYRIIAKFKFWYKNANLCGLISSQILPRSEVQKKTSFCFYESFKMVYWTCKVQYSLKSRFLRVLFHQNR